MTQEHKELLFKDLCVRLPYGIRAFYYGVEDEIESITLDGYVKIGKYSLPIEHIKPYLFPLSNMTKEQFLELTDLCNMYDDYNDYDPHEYWGIQVCRKHIHRNNLCFSNNYETIDWFNKNHFDYRGLIEKGLAIDATGLNIY